MGKSVAGLATISINLVALWLMVIGLGLIFLGGRREARRSRARWRS
jgi:ABC-2 type transport system permease protein